MTLEQMNWALGTLSAYRPLLDTEAAGCLRRMLGALTAADGREIGIQAIPALFALVGQIQEETHRFAIQFNRKQRTGRVQGSTLDQIPGVGEVRRVQLLKHFNSVKAVRAAAPAQLEEAVDKRTARAVYRHFHGDEKSEE